MSKSNISSKLVHRITFLQNISKSETDLERWEEKIYSFAEIKPICDNRFVSMEGIQFGHVISEGYFQFSIRYIKEITSDMRISFHAKLFEIKRIIDVDERGRMLKIIALEI